MGALIRRSRRPIRLGAPQVALERHQHGTCRSPRANAGCPPTRQFTLAALNVRFATDSGGPPRPYRTAEVDPQPPFAGAVGNGGVGWIADLRQFRGEWLDRAGSRLSRNCQGPPAVLSRAR